MKLVKITDNHYVVVDDSPKTKDFCIPIGTKYLDDTYAIRKAVTEDIDYWASRKDYYIITHSTRPFGGSATAISLHDVKELIGEIDVEKKADEMGFYDSGEDNKGNITTKAFIAGYNQALEDNKEKKFSEQDMIDFAKRCFAKCDDENFYELVENEIESLKHNTQWEIEIVNGKIKMI